MEKHHGWLVRLICALSILVLMFSFCGTLSVQAQDPQPACPKVTCPPAETPDLTAEQTATLKLYTKVTQKGWYSSAGVGMQNRGYGTIYLAAPNNSTTTKAYLYWSVIGPSSMKVADLTPPHTVRTYNYARGYINGKAITGTLVASTRPDVWYPGTSLGSWYPTAVNVYVYRADVKAYVNKNVSGTYLLTGFASGETDGADPWQQTSMNFPLVDGASLVVFFSNPNYPTSTLQIYNGAFRFPSGVFAHLSIPGVNAVYPTGIANATFIGAEGAQSTGADGVTNFFDASLPVPWNGAVLNGNGGANFLHGNMWDNISVDLHSLLHPPENDFWFSTSKPIWTPIWVAMVLAYSSGAQDTDGDGLPDGWELNGFDYNGDGIVDVPLNVYGANMWHKDLFIEADYMNNGGNYLPPVANLNDLVTVFGDAPVNNPDGQTGIHLHIDTGGADATSAPGTYAAFNLGGGNQVPFTANLGTDTSANCTSYNWSAFQAYKDQNFYSSRIPIFHYMIFANDLAPCLTSTSGISRNGATDSVFIKGAMDFIVSLGDWMSNGAHGSGAEREGTFMHELGHNLGLRHGGNDHVNYKPNYLSVMNYYYQTSGVWRDGNYHFDYSGFLLPTLNESALKESVGLGPLPLVDGYATKYVCPNGSLVFTYINPTMDWNCNSVIDSTNVKVDLNYDGKYTSLGSQNNWASITFKGNGVVGNANAVGELSAQGPMTTLWTEELKADQVPPMAYPPVP